MKLTGMKLITRRMLFHVTAAAVFLSGAAVSSVRGAEPFQGIVDTARGLFGVDVDVENGVRVRAGLINIHVDDDDGGRHDHRDRAWLFRGQSLARTPVMDARHQEIGMVDDVVVDLRSGKVRYIAVEYPTLRGRDKLFAVPWNRFQLARQKKGGYYLVVDIEDELFKRAPGFARSKWPNFADRRWAESIDVYYGVTIKPGDVKTGFGTDPDPVRHVEHLERLSRINGFPIIDKGVDKGSDKRIGEVTDVIVDFATGHVRYAVLYFPGSIGNEDRRFAVPMQRLSYMSENGESRLLLEVDRRTLGRAPGFDQQHWPSLRDPEFSDRVDEFYDIRRR